MIRHSSSTPSHSTCLRLELVPPQHSLILALLCFDYLALTGHRSTHSASSLARTARIAIHLHSTLQPVLNLFKIIRKVAQVHQQRAVTTSSSVQAHTMGRSSYTASTVTHLSHAAGSGCLSISSHHAGESSHIKLLDTLPAALNDSMNSSSSSVATTSARVKDTPTSWAQRQFDPDDESLPAVEEVSRHALNERVTDFMLTL